MDIFLNQLIQFYSNNTLNLHPFTPRIMPCYTHKMAIVSWPPTDYVTSLTMSSWQRLSMRAVL